MNSQRQRFFLWIAAIWIISVGLSCPLITVNSRYLYQEDDGHHFNHTVEMAQQRTLDPQYFNKPALHFYLRMPVVYGSVAWEKFRGRMSSIKEIRTRDPYGLGNYAFTPSHPSIVSWNRFLSASWSALLSVLVFVALIWLTQSTGTALFGAAITTLSPEVLKNSYIVGVDTLMGLGCLSCAVFALASLRSLSQQRLIACSVIAGLACAAKYNAAPIVVVPLIVWWLYDRTKRNLIVCGIAVFCGYLLGAPYSLISFNRFVEGVGFEIWHYGVAGHEGASSERGLSQAKFYLGWLLSDGVGFITVSLSVIGLMCLFRKNRRAAILLAAFPLTYTLLMIFQKVNFTRNMLTVVPFVSIFAAYGLHALISVTNNAWIRATIIAGFIAATLIPTGRASLTFIEKSLAQVESRDIATDWIKAKSATGQDIAIAGPLQFPFSTLALSGVDAFNPDKSTAASLLQAGYHFMVVPSDSKYLQTDVTTVAMNLEGYTGQQRVPRNPAISILEFKETAALQASAQAPNDFYLAAVEGHAIATCQENEEDHCWVQKRVSNLHISAASGALSMTVMSPWLNQRLEIIGENGVILVSTTLSTPGSWETIPLPTSRENTNETGLILVISDVHSPASRGIGRDSRRLGIAIKRR